jgi:glycosyltransferase involved in cell wall biosynthesis
MLPVTLHALREKVPGDGDSVFLSVRRPGTARWHRCARRIRFACVAPKYFRPMLRLLNMTPLVSVVVPVYNSASGLALLRDRLDEVMLAANLSYELVLVNDGSSDGSWGEIRALSAQHPEVRGVSLMRNYGQHNALLCGIRAASGDVIVTLDDDLQNPPEEIPRLLAKLGEDFDVVYGTPERQQHGVLRDIASRITKIALQSAMGAATARNVSAFRAFRTRTRGAFAAYQSPFVSIDVLLTWATTRFAAITVKHNPRRSGRSQYTARKLVTHALNMMTGFSTLPLQVASMIGFGLTLFGVLVLAYVIGRYVWQGGSVPGFPFLASIITIFSGAQLFSLGIIGEYLSRMHFRMMERPPYVVGESVGPSRSGQD